MDKRSIIFIISVSLSLFVISLFFSHQRDKKIYQQRLETKKIEKRELELLEQTAREKTITSLQLPLIYLFKDESCTQFLSKALWLGDTAMLMAPHSIPERVYHKDDSGNISSLQLFLNNEKQNPFLIYTKVDKKPIIPFIEKDNYSSLEVYLWEPSSDVVSWAYICSNKIKVPLQKEKSKSSFVLSKMNDKWFIVGFYNPKENSVTPIEWALSLKDYLHNVYKPMHVTERKSLEKVLSKQEYFVLENEYLQLVFSSIGGALSEINLPFRSETNKHSVVRPIEIDRDTQQEQLSSSNFPIHPYFKVNDLGERIKQEKLHEGGYYPLLRRDIIGSQARTSLNIPPDLYALNIVSDYPEVAKLNYKVTTFDHNSITFETVQKFRKITKKYSLEKVQGQDLPYCVNLSITVEGDNRGLWLSSGIPEVELISGIGQPEIQKRLSAGGKNTVEKISLPKDMMMVTNEQPDWISNANGFFSVIMDPLEGNVEGYKIQKIAGERIPTRLLQVNEYKNQFKPGDFPGYQALLPLSDKTHMYHYRFYLGPLEGEVLKKVDALYTEQEGGNPDYQSVITFHGWVSFISEPFSKILMVVMTFFHALTSSWGVAIILLTVVLRIVLYPLNAWSMKSMRRMQKISPMATQIQKKYKNDPKRSQMEIMKLYRDKKVNPMGGCLPILIQFPFLIGMFDLLKSTFQLRGACFIPGWIDNLAAPDLVFEWSTPIVFIGNGFHLLPFFLGIIMYFSQKINSSLPEDKSVWTDQQKQQKMMGTIMTFVMVAMFYKLPSGLNIYMISSMLLGILQQWVINKKLSTELK